MSNLTLDVDQAGELKAAFRRGDWTNAEIKRLCEGNTLAEVRKILLGQVVIALRERAFKIENSIITMTVVTRKRTDVKDELVGQIVRDLGARGFCVSDGAKDLMAKPDFVTTEGVTLKFGVIKGEEFTGAKRITKNIRAEAKNRGWLTPPAEAAPLLREILSDDDIKEMDLVWLTVMHEPITDSHGNPPLLGVGRSGAGSSLSAYYDDDPDDGWSREGGFLFLFPQDSPQA